MTRRGAPLGSGRRTSIRRASAALAAATVGPLALASSVALAIPGPATTAVVANGNLADSVALARLYLAARAIPDRQLCLLDLPDRDTIDLDTFVGRLLEPLDGCLRDREVDDRIEAVVLARGVPLRVEFPDRGGGAQRASLAATLGAAGALTPEGTRLIDVQSPGRRVMCGSSPCLAAAWTNPFRGGRFEPGWRGDAQGIEHRPRLVTMLHGRSYFDAARLIASATTAEASPLGPDRRNRRFMLMAGADRARGVLDQEYQQVALGLTFRGFEAVRVAFDPGLSGQTLAAFVTGTANLGDTIEGNAFAPGAVVDNLTSLGAVPENFREMGGERQVSVARWVALGVAGVHGATDEPLNNCFPSRRFLLDWADGLTLAEAYHRNLPFTLWRNLVVGDAMAAAWAERPTVIFEDVDAGDVIEGSAFVTAVATPSAEIESLVLYADGAEVARTVAPGARLRACVPVPRGDRVQLLAVAGTRGAGSAAAAKGWAETTVVGRPGPSDCSPAAADAGAPDEGDDAGPTDGSIDAGAPDGAAADATIAADAGSGPRATPESSGCRCSGPRAHAQAPARGLGLISAGAAALVGRRRRRRSC